MEPTPNSQPSRDLVFVLRRRAKTSWVTATVAFVLVFVIIVFSISLFYYAPNIVIREITSLASPKPPRDQAPKQVQAPTEQAPRQLQAPRGQDDKQAQAPKNEAPKQVREQAANEPEKVLISVNAYIMYVLVSTTIARLGAVLLLVFGAQLLIGFYRYNLKLAAFYNSRADAFELLIGQSLELFPSVVPALAADQIDMGKSPKTPSEEAVRFVEALAEVRNRPLG